MNHAYLLERITVNSREHGFTPRVIWLMGADFCDLVLDILGADEDYENELCVCGITIKKL